MHGDVLAAGLQTEPRKKMFWSAMVCLGHE
jgi:hypothetical protein